HLVARNSQGQALAIMPCYLKSHSMGEYVFDHAWAHAFEAAGGDYYPKLQVCVPFSPITGPRILARSKADLPKAITTLGAAACELTRRHNASSLHITFADPTECAPLKETGFLHRTDRQFHWVNDDYDDFDGFLARLNSRKRKLIRRERKRSLDAGISIECLTGGAIEPHHWRAFFGFYMDTATRKWGNPYLTEEFFSLLGQRMADHVLLIMARRQGRYIAGALNLIGRDALFGRYWGAIEHHDCLHFEVCYYRAIEFAIANGLQTVEAGAQGEHKLARGYMPTTTHSLHYFAHQGLSQAVQSFLDQERRAVAEGSAYLSASGPFARHAPPPADNRKPTDDRL
ncbi:MAG: GNAT family N-acetyltransferase, partial [Alphaproteobacteria bacterium]